MENQISREIENQIIDNYVNKHYGQLKSGLEFGISQGLVKKILIKNNIPIRTFSQAAILSNKNRKIYNNNDDYFKTESPSMAWILGFIASDGTIRKSSNSIKIGLSIVDKEILERIKNEVGIEPEIKIYTTSKGYECASLSWTSEEHKNDLAKYNIIPDKTFQLKPPLILNKKYWIDYIRGYFDGDGSINYIQATNSIRWQVCGALPEMLEFIVNHLYNEYNIPKVTIQKQSHNGGILYYIQYAKRSSRMIHEILYTPNSLYLTRKKEKFDFLFEMIPLKE